MSKKLAKKEKTTALATNFAEDFWDEGAIESENLLIPKLLIGQGLSKAVTDGKARFGEFYDSVDFEILGNAFDKDAKPVKIVLVARMGRFWERSVAEGQKWSWREVTPYTPANARWKYIEDEVNDKGETEQWKNVRSLRYFVFLYDQIDNPEAMPLVLNCRSTSFSAGQKMDTHISKCKNAKSIPQRQVFELSATKESNDDGTWFKFDLTKTDVKLTDEQLGPIGNWRKQINEAKQTGALVVDESENLSPDKGAAPIDTSDSGEY